MRSRPLWRQTSGHLGVKGVTTERERPMSLRAFGARLCSRAGAGSAALAHAPPRLREHLSGVAVGRLQQLEPLLRTVELREAAKGMEKGLGIGADTIELLHQRNYGELFRGDPVRILRGEHAGRCGTFEGSGMVKMGGGGWLCVLKGDGIVVSDDGNLISKGDLVYDIDALLSSWRGIERGKELFVTGLQNFDIPAAYAGLHERRLKQLPSSTQYLEGIGPKIASRLEEAGVPSVGALASLQGDAIDRVLASTSRLSRERLEKFIRQATGTLSRLDLWIFSAHALQAFGHFPALARDNPTALRHVEAILALGAESPQRQHLVTHSTWWGDGENANALDELVAPGSDWPEGGETLPPPTLLRRLREAAALRRLGPDVRFPHLDAVKDPPVDGDASLRVLRSSHEIERVGKELRNCAGMYADRVRSGNYALVALFKGDKVKALAGYALGGTSWDHRAVGSGNRNASKEVKARFDTFLPTLREWSNSGRTHDLKYGTRYETLVDLRDEIPLAQRPPI